MDNYHKAFITNKHKAAKVIDVSKHSWLTLIKKFIPADLSKKDKFEKTFNDYYTDYYITKLKLDVYENNIIPLDDVLKWWKLCDCSPVFIYFLYKKGYRNVNDLKLNVNAVIRAMYEKNCFDFDLLLKLVSISLFIKKIYEHR